jgi:23S rRNA (uridine2552-2'-O)-methyltransferase
MAKNKFSKAWIQQHVNDPYVQRAKAEGMRSRAVYKLLQIDEKERCSKVVAIDLLPMEPLAGVDFIQKDFATDEGLAAVEAALAGAKADLVLSDMAPNISGIALTDQLRLIGLTELALDFAAKHLKPQGNFLVKVFQGEGFDGFVKAMRGVFVQVRTHKPDASRKGSREVYLLGRGLKAVATN